MAAGGVAAWLVNGAMRELGLFAAVGLLLGGLDDLLIDLIWLARRAWREATVYRIHARATLETLSPPDAPGRIAIFIGAWREAPVIGDTLATAIERFGDGDYRIYVGVYPNDPATVSAIRAVATAPGRVRIVAGLLDGPTSKAEALNRCWDALIADELREGIRAKAILLHDAEDFVHAGELRLFDRLIERFDLVQIPVRPLNAGDLWGVSGHYLDEFAEAHGKQIVVREAIGASVPSAGTGCAIARDMLGRIAAARGGRPFDADSLTEDYELGLRLRDYGGRGVFVRLPERPGGGPVAVEAYFPDRRADAVRQKARWVQGIALAGWERLGWRGGLAETWMRLRDRRAPLAAAILMAAYASFTLAMLGWAAGFVAARTILGGAGIPVWLLIVNSSLLGWRMLVRALLVARAYGWREGLLAGPRMLVSSVVTIGAAVRAFRRHLWPPRRARWDKTDHAPRQLRQAR